MACQVATGLASNGALAQIEALLKQICGDSRPCRDIVLMIVAAVEMGIPPNLVCQKAELCNATRGCSLYQKWPISHLPPPLVPWPPPADDDADSKTGDADRASSGNGADTKGVDWLFATFAAAVTAPGGGGGGLADSVVAGADVGFLRPALMRAFGLAGHNATYLSDLSDLSDLSELSNLSNLSNVSDLTDLADGARGEGGPGHRCVLDPKNLTCYLEKVGR
jgi:hypothetical protein